MDGSAVKPGDLRSLRRFVMGVRQPYLLTRMGQTRRRAYGTDRVPGEVDGELE